jgi:hypothetical protein
MVEPTRRNSAGYGGGLLLIVLGIFFLIGQFFEWDRWSFAWPFFIIVPGALFLVAAFLGGQSSSGLAIPGSIITMVGLLLLYQEITQHYESWAYAWALIPTAVGVGIMVDGRLCNDPLRVQRGRRLAAVGLTLLAAGFVFFELLLNIGGWFDGMIGGTIVSFLLIGAGIYLFVRNPRRPGISHHLEGEITESGVAEHEGSKLSPPL